MRVYVIEDTKVQALKIRHALESLGHTVEIANLQYEVGPQMAKFNPDTVFLDIHLFHKECYMCGFTLVPCIRAYSRPNIPIIVCSSDITEENLRVAVHHGVFDMMVKPYALTTLQHKMAKVHAYYRRG